MTTPHKRSTISIDCDDVIVTTYTNLITPKSLTTIKLSKGGVCREIGSDIPIDDHPHHGRNALAANISKVVVFGDYLWNQFETLPERMVCYLDRQGVVDEINTYAR